MISSPPQPGKEFLFLAAFADAARSNVTTIQRGARVVAGLIKLVPGSELNPKLALSLARDPTRRQVQNCWMYGTDR
jgi:hypothetical protein